MYMIVLVAYRSLAKGLIFSGYIYIYAYVKLRMMHVQYKSWTVGSQGPIMQTTIGAASDSLETSGS